MASSAAYPYSLTSEDRLLLENLRVPIPSNEAKRIETLRRSKILDEELRGAPFDRFTSLATRLFDVSVARQSNQFPCLTLPLLFHSI
ncbi:hypothetical protein EON65_54280 [archaeon]|nr:MAG: hypothetical protein EON65_54280 [archaeon]